MKAMAKNSKLKAERCDCLHNWKVLFCASRIKGSFSSLIVRCISSFINEENCLALEVDEFTRLTTMEWQDAFVKEIMFISIIAFLLSCLVVYFVITILEQFHRNN